MGWLKLMQKYDTDHSGAVSQTELENKKVVQLFALLSRGAQVDQRAQLAWHIIDGKEDEKTSVPGLEDLGKIDYNTFLQKVEADPSILERVFDPLMGPMRIQCRLRWSWKLADSFSTYMI